MLFWEKNADYCQSRTKLINTFCEQNAETLCMPENCGAPINFVTHILLSLRVSEIKNRWMDLYTIWYWRGLLKIVDTLKF